jgi:hypothetical protein
MTKFLASVALALLVMVGRTAAQGVPSIETLSDPDKYYPEVVGPMLDAALARNDLPEVFRLMKETDRRPTGVRFMLTWLQEHIQNGDTIWLTQQFAIIQWNIGLTDGPANPAIEKEYKTRGVFSLVDTMVQIIVEGARCDDMTAWQAHWRQSAGETAIWQYAATLPEDLRRHAAAEALRFESEVSPKRKDDAFLCSGGMDSMTAGAPTHDPRLPGTTYNMTPDPNYQPKFVAAEVWRKRQADARARLPALVAKLLSLPPG